MLTPRPKSDSIPLPISILNCKYLLYAVRVLIILRSCRRLTFFTSNRGLRATPSSILTSTMVR